MEIIDEPWTVETEDAPPSIILTCKKADERDLIVRKLKYSLVFRKIKRDKENPLRCTISCKHLKDRDKKLAIMLTTMNMIRIKQTTQEKSAKALGLK